MTGTLTAMIERSLKTRTVRQTVDYLAGVIESPPSYQTVDAVRRGMDKRRVERTPGMSRADEKPIGQQDHSRRDATFGCERMLDRTLKLYGRYATRRRCTIEDAARQLLNPPRAA